MTTNEKKAKVQAEANAAIDANGGFGLVAMATGTGKSKVGVDRAFTLASFFESALINLNPPKILLVVPTEKLRDEGWKNEFYKWNMDWIWDKYIERTCYASLNTYEGEDWDLVILDECHNITENNSLFFHNNTVKSCIGLTATPPRDLVKVRILSTILKFQYEIIGHGVKVHPTYQITLDQAVEMGLIAPYEVIVITLPIDTTDKYIKKEYTNKTTGKREEFYQTEANNYAYLTRSVDFGSNPMARINRMRFIYTLKSKTEAAKKILEHVIPKNIRTLIFCGSKVQANAVCDYRYYSKPTKPSIPKKLRGSFNTVDGQFDLAVVEKMKEYITYLKKLAEYEEAIKYYQGIDSITKFENEEINRCSCCEALNEGHNINRVDCAFIIQLNAQEKDLKQRMGRILREREGHVGKIIILATENTVDMEWTIKATNTLDADRVRTISLEDLKTGKEKINF